MTILLDSGPLGLLAGPSLVPEGRECQAWLKGIVAARHEIVLPEIIVYELRRELLRLDKLESLQKIEALKLDYLHYPLTTTAMYKAAEFWADIRKRGKPTASEKALDIEVILAAQTWELAQEESGVAVATTNLKHLSRFVRAEHWKSIKP